MVEFMQPRMICAPGARRPIHDGTTTPSIALIYQDLGVGKRGKEICDRLLQSSASGSLHVWSLKLIENQITHGEACESLRTADVVVMALRSEATWTLDFETWLLDSLTARQQKPGLMIAAFDESEMDPHEAKAKHAHLESLALKTGLDFIAHLPRPERVV